MATATLNADGKTGPREPPRLGLPTSALILLLLTHIWPWWLPAIDRDQDVWIALAVGQLSFWPLFAGLIGVRLRWPITSLLAGTAVAFGMLWYCRWQFGFHGYFEEPARDVKPFAVLGAIGAAVALVVYVVCVRVLRKAERTNSDQLVRHSARSGALTGLAIAGGTTLLLGVPWLCLASKRELADRGPTVAAVAVAAIAGLASAGALWATMLALVRNPPRFSWRRTAVLTVTTAAGAAGLAAWLLMPLVRHHQACKALQAAGAEISTWDGFWEARLGDKLEQLGIARQEPFWKRWYRAYVPNVMSIRVDGESVAYDQLAALSDIRDDSFWLDVHDPDPDNRILQELSKVRGIRYLNISFSAPDEVLFPNPGFLNDDAFSHIAALDDLNSIKLFNVRFSPNGLKRLVGKVDLEILHLDFCDAGDETVNVLGEFENLASLALRHTQVTDDGLRPLGKLKKLEILWLDLSPIRGDGFAHLTTLQRLQELSLQGCHVRDDALRHLASIPHLRRLDLRNTGVTGRGLGYLDRLPSLEQIELEGAALDDAGFMSAAGMPWRVKLVLGELRSLSLPGIVQMHQERSRLLAMPIGTIQVFDDEFAVYVYENNEDRHGFVEPYEEWVDEAGEEGEADDDNEDEVLVDAEMELNHNTIIWHQYGVADELIEAYCQNVLGEPVGNDDESGVPEADVVDDNGLFMPRDTCAR